MRLLIACLLLVLAGLVSPAQQLSSSQREILTLQDQRSLSDGKLLSYLGNSDSNLRRRALIALANLQDTTTVEAVVPLLQDAAKDVRAAAAFALGQIGSRVAQDSLLGCLKNEAEPSVTRRILEALGKLGDERALDEVVAFEPSTDTIALRAEGALSIARFALRGVKNEPSMWRCFDLTVDPSPMVRSSALYALWRSAPHGLIDVEIAKRADDLVRLASDADPDVRLNLVTLLARSQSREAVEIYQKIRQSERLRPEWRVQAQMARTLAAFAPGNPELVGQFVDYLGAANDHVKIAALQAMTGLSRQLIESSEDSIALRDVLIRLATTKNAEAELTRGEAFVALARFFPDEFVRRNFLREQDLSQREKTKVIEGLSLIPTGRSLSIITAALEDSSVRITMAGWDFVRRFLTPTMLTRMRAGEPDWVDVRNALYRKTVLALRRGDMAITQLVSNALGDTAYFAMFREAGQSDSLVVALSAAYARLSSPDDVEAMQSALTAMGSIGDARFVPTLEKALQDPDKTVVTLAAGSLRRITGKDYSDRIPKATRPVHTDYDWSTLESLRPDHTARLRTSKGIITIRLLKEHAPFTVLSFVKLVKKGFYNGLSFHRVVPNFVIQGGDPRGDGWGGPGYAIRSEFSLVNFGRGAVGVASAGKDTEGCQFFITHSPVPHLDGRYTIFGMVVEGQEVVDRIQVGDIITEIALE